MKALPQAPGWQGLSSLWVLSCRVKAEDLGKRLPTVGAGTPSTLCASSGVHTPSPPPRPIPHNALRQGLAPPVAPEGLLARVCVVVVVDQVPLPVEHLLAYPARVGPVTRGSLLVAKQGRALGEASHLKGLSRWMCGRSRRRGKAAHLCAPRGRVLAEGLPVLGAREPLVPVMRALVLHQLRGPRGGLSALVPDVGSPGALPTGTTRVTLMRFSLFCSSWLGVFRDPF